MFKIFAKDRYVLRFQHAKHITLLLTCLLEQFFVSDSSCVNHEEGELVLCISVYGICHQPPPPPTSLKSQKGH